MVRYTAYLYVWYVVLYSVHVQCIRRRNWNINSSPARPCLAGLPVPIKQQPRPISGLHLGTGAGDPKSCATVGPLPVGFCEFFLKPPHWSSGLRPRLHFPIPLSYGSLILSLSLCSHRRLMLRAREDLPSCAVLILALPKRAS